MPFCIIWANENWTRTWDGLENDILMAQDYSKSDESQFIIDLKKYLLDDRYIRVNGKPLIILYAPNLLPNIRHTLNTWRTIAIKEGIGEITIWTVRIRNQTAVDWGIEDLIDGEVQFPPHNINLKPKKTTDNDGGTSYLFDYEELVDKQINEIINSRESERLHRAVMMAWDNSPRRKNGYSSFGNFSPKAYYSWLSATTQYTVAKFKGDNRIQFINAWNEWAEGTYLEPDLKYGYSCINLTSQAIFSHPYNGMKMSLDSEHGQTIKNNKKIAVQIHAFYPDVMPEIIHYMNYIPIDYDIYITTDTNKKKQEILSLLKESTAINKKVDVVQNRGRDVAPFLSQMKGVISNYDYICHIHTKKSKHEETESLGDNWRRYLLENLFGNTNYFSNLLSLFNENDELGLIYPETYKPLTKWMQWGRNKEKVQELLSRMGFSDIELPENPDFPAGTMFWAKVLAVKPLFDLEISDSEFDNESGQIDATIAHAIERCWVYVTILSGYTWVNCNRSDLIGNNEIFLPKQKITNENKGIYGKFVHLFRKNNK